MRAVLMHEYGGPKRLRYEETPDPTPAERELLVRVEAAALNHLDLDLCAGTARIPVQLPHILGCEGVGTVEWVPKELTDQWRVGEPVMILEELPCGRCRACRAGHANRCDAGSWTGVSRQGTYAELIAVPSGGLIKLPEADISPAAWAAVQGAFGTAWHMLITRGHLKAGETVLINGVGSGIGSAALQVATLAGARVIASAGSPSKIEHAISNGAAGGVNYATEDLATAVDELSHGAGVDLVFDHIGGAVLPASLKTVRPGGRLVTCGAHAGEVVDLDVIELFRSEISLIGSRTCTPDELRTVVGLVGERKLTSVIDSTFPFSDATSAFDRMAQRLHYGKIVLTPAVGD